MLQLFVDTCVWLDLAKDPHQHGVVGALEEMIGLGEVSLIVPRIVLEEFRRNRERIANEGAKSLSSVFKKVRESVDRFGQAKGKSGALAQIDDVRHRLPLLVGHPTGALDRIEKLLSGSTLVETNDSIKLSASARAIERRAPFHRNKNSFADAMLIELYADCVQHGASRVRFAFVTHNTHDFSDPSGDERNPHPDLLPMFSRIKSRYFIRLRDALRRVGPGSASDLLREHDAMDEPRPLVEVLQTLDELWDKVWYNRHHVLREKVLSGRIMVVDRESVSVDRSRATIQRGVWKLARAAARRKEKKYGRARLGPWSDFEWGLLSGKLSAIRWVLGEDWDSTLDT